MSTSWVGSFLLRVVVVVALFFSVSASAQTPSLIEPYEVLYGKPQLIQRALTPDRLTPSSASLALVQARTESMLARLGSVAATFGPGIGNDKLQRWATSIKRENTEAAQLRERGKPYAAWDKAIDDYLEAEFLSGLVEAIVNSAVQTHTAGTGSTSRLSEVRARLNTFYTHLGVVPVNSVSVALALSEAYGAWVELTSLHNLVENRPAQLLAMLQLSGAPVAPGKQGEFIREVMEPVFISIIQCYIEEAELALQASQADIATLVRPDEAELRKIARAYAEAARENRQLAQRQKEAHSLPDRGSERQFAGYLDYKLNQEGLSFEEQHRDEKGMAGALLLLGISRSAYSSSLAELIEIQVQLDPAVTLASTALAENEMDRLRKNRIVDAEQRTREAAAQARSVLGHVPALVSLNYAQAQELTDGSIEDREKALTELMESRTLAELAAALGAPPLGASTPIDDSLASSPSDFIRVCIGRLRFAMEGPAYGLLQKRSISLSRQEFRELFMNAVVQTCTSARDLTSSMPRSLFLEVFYNEVMTWFREVKIHEHAMPKLTDVCATLPRPDQELLERQSCTLTQQAMSMLSEEDRQILELNLIQELSYEEIGQRIGITKAAAEKRGQRALAKLRAAYKQLDPFSVSLWFYPQRWLGELDRLASIRTDSLKVLANQGFALN